jgi:hypothetical protein
MEEYDLALVQQVAANTTLATLNHLASAETARQEALIVFEQNHPGFFERLNANRKTLQEQRPALGEAIAVAEQDARRQQDLIQLYECANDYLVVASGASSQPRTADRREPDPAAPRDLSTSAARQRVISSFEKRFGTDVDIDRADTSQANLG